MPEMRNEALVSTSVSNGVFISPTTNRLHCPQCGGFRFEIVAWGKAQVFCTACDWKYRSSEIKVWLRPEDLSEDLHEGVHAEAKSEG